jgi:hypothetical protein
MKERQGGRCEQLLDDIKKTREYWKLKEKTLDRILCGSRFQKGYGPVVRQTTEWMNNLHKKIYKFETPYAEHSV